MNQPLNELGKTFLATSNSKGFTAGNLSYQDTVEKLMLTVSELAEALEELRKGFAADHIYFHKDADGLSKPEGFPIELADVLIRVLQLSAACDIDMDAAVNMKNTYNSMRPYKHGKKF